MEDNDKKYTAGERRGAILHEKRAFGKSRLGAPLELFGPGKIKDACLVMAGQHGTEPETTVLLSSVMRSIPPGLLDSLVIPALNPDGLARGTRCNAAGVDLNRNFPASNWTEKPVYYSWNNEVPHDTELSAGAGPGSEPETSSLLNLLSEVSPSVIISIHAPMECIDDPASSGLAKWISSETGLPLVKEIGYPTPGSLGSWAVENSISLITFELPSDTIQNIRRRFSPLLMKILLGEYRKF